MKTGNKYKYCSKCDKVVDINLLEKTEVCDKEENAKDCPLLNKPDIDKSNLSWKFHKWHYAK